MNTPTDTYQQLQSLLGTDASGALSPTIALDTGELLAPLMPFIIISILLSLLFIMLYILGMVRKFKVEKAIFETRDILRDMNERQKLALEPKDTLLASTAPTEQASSTQNATG